MRNVKFLALAMMTMLAVSAPASADELTAESYPAVLKGSSEGSPAVKITTTDGNISCSSMSSLGTISASTTTASVTTTLGECTALGFTGTVEMNGCSFLYHLEGEGATTATSDIVCPAGKEITIKSFGLGMTKCIIHIFPQKGLRKAVFKNVGSAATRELTAEIELGGIIYTHTKGSGIGSCTEGTGTIGTFVSKVLVTGEKDGGGAEHLGVFVS